MFDPFGGFGLVFNRRPLAILLCLVLVTSSTTLLTFAAPSAPQSVSPTHAGSTALGPILPPSSRPFVDSELSDASGLVPVVVAFDPSAPVDRIATLLDSVRILPGFGGVRIARGTIDASRLAELEASPYVRSILKDRLILPAFPPGAPSNAPQPANPLRFKFDSPRPSGSDLMNGKPEVDMSQVVNFTGARAAWTQLGVDGSGVTIAVVDSGVDHGAFNLGNRSAARDATGLPTSFDPDGGTFAFTTIRASSFPFSGRQYVRTLATDPLIFIFDLAGAFGPVGPAQLRWSDPRLFGSAFPANMDVTGIAQSLGGAYHFGVLSEWHLIDPYIYLDIFPVLVVDAHTAGVFDTVYLDLSFDYWLNGFSPAPSPDFSFADEPRLQPRGGNVVAARDMDADGYPDVSAGSLAQGLDIWGLEPTPAERYHVLAPIDAGGDHIVMVYDWFNHGTSVAASAAGQQSSHPFAGPGIAPGAKIMGVPIFFWGDVLEGWLWAAGFDLVDDVSGSVPVPDYGFRYGNWTYTGNHKADVISNSWGVSNWILAAWFFQYPWYGVLTALEDALSTPGYSSPNYPGTLFVHAAGNGGAGYGTVTEPGFSSLALTVGASTSLNNTALDFGGHHNDVMSWSARGPNAFGAPKPDLVMVGAFAYTSAAPWTGNGTGSKAYTLFGGTSQATPLGSASAAIVIEAYLRAHGVRPSPFEVKSILKSTALDLGYDAFVQGTGQINVFSAAENALGQGGMTVTSPATWDNVRPGIRQPWAASSAYYGREVRPSPPAGPILDPSWFAGYVHPGGTSSAMFTLSPATGVSSGSVAAVWHARIGTLWRNGTTAVIGTGWLEGYGAVIPLPSTAIPSGTDLMVVRATMPYTSFDPEFDYAWNQRGRIVVGEWTDANGNGTVQPNEVRVFNYGYNTGTSFEARIGFPKTRMTGAPVLWFSQVPAPGGSFTPIPYSIQVEFYQRVTWNWISLPTSFSASAATDSTLTAHMTVPANAMPGVYEGQILLTPLSGNRTAIPVSVVVPRVLDGSALSAPLTGPASSQVYDSSTVLGYFDWRWRYEAGDWRLWYIDVTDPEIIAVRVNATWSGFQTDVDLFSLTPSGVPGDSSPSPFLGNGAFYWDTRTGRGEEYVVVNTDSSLGQAGPGLYGFALHNVLYDGGPGGEHLSGTASIAKLSPRGPLTLTARPGTVVSLPFTLTTGFNMHFVNWLNSFTPSGSAFPALTEPAYTQQILAGKAQKLWANYTVPDNATEGLHENFLLLGSAEFTALVRVNIVVDATPPAITLVSPGTEGTFLGKTATIRAIVTDVSPVESVTFQAATAGSSLSFNATAELWTAAWDTTSTPDGPVTFTVRATDAAGNAALASLPITIDNTLPAVSISAPSDGAQLSGLTEIQWSATDTNIESVRLAIDGVGVDVTRDTTYPFVTTLFGDGLHSIEVRATDKAGNERVVRISVTVNNSFLSSGGFVSGLAIGLIVAAVAGFVLGVIWTRRRRPPPPERVSMDAMPPPPTAPPLPPAGPPIPPSPP